MIVFTFPRNVRSNAAADFANTARSGRNSSAKTRRCSGSRRSKNICYGSHAIFLVDAVKSGAAPGKIYRFNGQIFFIPKDFFNLSTHNFGTATAIELARILNRLPRLLIIYGIEGKCFEAGRGLRPEVEKAARTVIEMLLADTFRATARVSNNQKGG